MSQTELQRLAQSLRRPPLSLSALAGLPPEQLVWLEQQVRHACQRAEDELRRDIDKAMPWPLRLMLPRRLRSPS